MEPLIAMQLEKVGKGVRITAYTRRDKNRRVAWRTVIPTRDSATIKQAVIDEEVQRGLSSAS